MGDSRYWHNCATVVTSSSGTYQNLAGTSLVPRTNLHGLPYPTKKQVITQQLTGFLLMTSRCCYVSYNYVCFVDTSHTTVFSGDCICTSWTVVGWLSTWRTSGQCEKSTLKQWKSRFISKFRLSTEELSTVIAKCLRWRAAFGIEKGAEGKSLSRVSLEQFYLRRCAEDRGGGTYKCGRGGLVWEVAKQLIIRARSAGNFFTYFVFYGRQGGARGRLKPPLPPVPPPLAEGVYRHTKDYAASQGRLNKVPFGWTDAITVAADAGGSSRVGLASCPLW